MIWEFSGVDAVAPLDQTAVLNSQPATASPSGASVTTTSAAEVIVSIANLQGTLTGIPSGNPFTNDSTVIGNGWAHLITSSTGTYSAQWIQSPSGTYSASTASFKAASSGGPLNPCDLALPYGTIDQSDVTAAVNMVLNPATCTANIQAPGVCDIVTVQRVVNAVLTGTCITGANPHSVTLTWVASTSPNVTGYNIYRVTTSGGPYNTKLNSSPVSATNYLDGVVQSGQVYFYVVTAVDSSGNESAFSNQAQGVIPSP